MELWMRGVPGMLSCGHGIPGATLAAMHDRARASGRVMDSAEMLGRVQALVPECFEIWLEQTRVVGRDGTKPRLYRDPLSEAVFVRLPMWTLELRHEGSLWFAWMLADDSKRSLGVFDAVEMVERVPGMIGVASSEEE